MNISSKTRLPLRIIRTRVIIDHISLRHVCGRPPHIPIMSVERFLATIRAAQLGREAEAEISYL